MKRSLNIIFILLLTIFFVSCQYDPLFLDPPKNLIKPINPKIEKSDELISGKKDVDILFLCYMDGDNSLHKNIWADLSEAVTGYNYIENKERIEVLILWDGQGNGDSALYEVQNNCVIKDISINIPFIKGKTSDGSEINELNMNDYKTLSSYLAFAKEHYNYNNIILQLSNHGAGPGSITISGRAMCQDIHTVNGKSSNELLGTKDIPLAIKESKIGKLDLVIQDVCFGSTVEEAYEYSDCAKYMLLSPNLMPGNGLDYVSLILNLEDYSCYKNGVLDLEKYLELAVLDFSENTEYKVPESEWNNLIKSNKNSGLSGDALRLKVSFDMINNTHIVIPTLTAINLSYMIELRKVIDNLVLSIPPSSKKLYLKAFGEMFSNLTKYKSPIGDLYDIGFMCNKILEMENPDVSNKDGWKTFQDNAIEIKEVLNEAIVSSFRDGCGRPLYNTKSKNERYGIPPLNLDSYGIAICGPTYKPYSSPSFQEDYAKDLAFGKNSQWNAFIKGIIKG